jgi:hypothetical protein
VYSFEGQNLCGIEQVGVNGDATFVVDVGVCDCGPMNLRFEDIEFHVRSLRGLMAAASWVRLCN